MLHITVDGGLPKHVGSLINEFRLVYSVGIIQYYDWKII